MNEFFIVFHSTALSLSLSLSPSLRCCRWMLYLQVEVAVLYRDATTNKMVQRFYAAEEVDAILKEITAASSPAGDV